MSTINVDNSYFSLISDDNSYTVVVNDEFLHLVDKLTNVKQELNDVKQELNGVKQELNSVKNEQSVNVMKIEYLKNLVQVEFVTSSNLRFKLDQAVKDFKHTEGQVDVYMDICNTLCEKHEAKVQKLTVQHAAEVEHLKKECDIHGEFYEFFRENLQAKYEALELEMKAKYDAFKSEMKAKILSNLAI